jgi:enoyl-CoA hydratase/carnithine racemase
VTEEQLLVVRGAGGVATLTLNRPEKRNALSIELREGLASALGEIAADDDARCTVLTGAGPAFCAGMDVTQFGGDEAHKRRLLAANEACFAALLDHPVPLLAAVNGPALGGGFALAAVCDVRVAARSAAFGFPEVRRGIPASLGAAMAALPTGLARELVVTGRVLDAGEALRAGLVADVVEDERLAEVAAERAAAIAVLPPRGIRTSVGWMRRDPAPSWREQLAREEALLRSTLLG